MYSYLGALPCGKCRVLDAKKHFLCYNKKDQCGMLENLSIVSLSMGCRRFSGDMRALTLFGAEKKPEKFSIFIGKRTLVSVSFPFAYIGKDDLVKW